MSQAKKNDVEEPLDVGDSVVIAIEPEGRESMVFAYPPDTPATEILADSTGVTGVVLAPEHIEVVTEEIHRSKWLGAGYEFGVKIDGIGGFKFKKAPNREVRTIKKIILRSKKKFT